MNYKALKTHILFDLLLATLKKYQIAKFSAMMAYMVSDFKNLRQRQIVSTT